MKTFYVSLSEKDRRRYAAVEAAKLGHGGIEYVARLLGCDVKTIRQGQRDLEQPPELPAGKLRKKATAAKFAGVDRFRTSGSRLWGLPARENGAVGGTLSQLCRRRKKGRTQTVYRDHAKAGSELSHGVEGSHGR